MKIIGLASFYRSENYGAVLQAFALCRMLKRIGADTFYLEYPKSKPLVGMAYLKNVANRVIRNFFGYRRRAALFRSFARNRIPHCKIGDICFDAYIIGSDQVWHPDYLRDSDNFFLLPEVKSEKIYSYASSFGVEYIPETMKEFYKNCLMRLKSIGVRENSGIGIVRGLGLNAVQNPDPTLLLTSKEWDEHVSTRIEANPYIFCYVMQGDHLLAAYIREAAEKLRKELGGIHKIVVMGDKEYKSLLPGYNLVCDAGPSEFLSYIKYSDYVITSSFHGTCFSINFNKPLKVLLRRDNRVNTRIVDLIDKLDIKDCLSYTDTPVSQLTFSKNDYNTVNNKLDYFRKSGIDYLKTVVNDA